MNTDDTKRLFFGMEVAAPWPEHLPSGRLLDVANRHMTLAFLGNVPFQPLFQQLSSLVPPLFLLGPVGIFDACLFLPPTKPNVAAWHVKWLPKEPEAVRVYQKMLVHWLKERGYALAERPFLEHVTMVRWAFDKEGWAKQSYAFPVVGRAIHLYESLGNLKYASRWSLPLIAPFEPLSHTADIAFKIRGLNLTDLYIHAQIALAFEYPPLIAYLDTTAPFNNDAIVEQLNKLLARADTEHGVPFKAVSYHGMPTQKGEYLEWEMIVDV